MVEELDNGYVLKMFAAAQERDGGGGGGGQGSASAGRGDVAHEADGGATGAAAAGRLGKRMRTDDAHPAAGGPGSGPATRGEAGGAAAVVGDLCDGAAARLGVGFRGNPEAEKALKEMMESCYSMGFQAGRLSALCERGRGDR